jgi:hypothetical protein
MPNKEYARAIQFLIDEKIIFNPIIGQELQIPEWFKITTTWWANNQILDTEYGESLQYLINEKIIIIPINQESFNQEPSSDKVL